MSAQTPPTGTDSKLAFTALFVRRPILAAVINTLLVVAGLAALVGVDVRELPDVDRPVISVRTTYGGASPQTIEREVTRTIEGAVARVSGVKAIAMEMDVIPVGLHQHSDTEIAAAVEHALSWNSAIPANQVRVTVEKGWVTLSGELDWNFQRRAVERMIRPLKGVVGIIDNIRLKAQSVPSNLSTRIQDALTRQAEREAKRIEISVDGSVVTLRGKVHSWAERSAAEGVTWAAPGVSRVNNQLTIEA